MKQFNIICIRPFKEASIKVTCFTCIDSLFRKLTRTFNCSSWSCWLKNSSMRIACTGEELMIWSNSSFSDGAKPFSTVCLFYFWYLKRLSYLVLSRNMETIRLIEVKPIVKMRCDYFHDPTNYCMGKATEFIIVPILSLLVFLESLANEDGGFAFPFWKF